jgi:photosystem II stability/assembly factor-like uncharacterized protein
MVAALAAIIAWGSTRGGSDHSPSGEPFVGGDLHSLVSDPMTAGRVFVGGHGGVAVSSDDARTFTAVRSLDAADAMGWAFNDAGIWLGGHPGLRLATAGLNFASHSGGLPGSDVHALGGTDDILYAASPNIGVFASTDDGRTWQMRTTRDGQSFMGRILVDPADADHAVAPTMDAGAVESNDGGRTWHRLGGPESVMWVSWLGGDTDRLAVSGGGQAAISPDGGKTWSGLSLPDGASIVEGAATEPNRLYAAGLRGTRARLWVSTDGGGSWRRP